MRAHLETVASLPISSGTKRHPSLAFLRSPTHAACGPGLPADRQQIALASSFETHACLKDGQSLPERSVTVRMHFLEVAHHNVQALEVQEDGLPFGVGLVEEYVRLINVDENAVCTFHLHFHVRIVSGERDGIKNVATLDGAGVQLMAVMIMMILLQVRGPTAFLGHEYAKGRRRLERSVNDFTLDPSQFQRSLHPTMRCLHRTTLRHLTG